MAAPTTRAQFKDYCLRNKYSNWYFSIVENAIVRALTKKTATCYVEGHHIVPRAISGQKKSMGEIVFLTAKEHFVCHLLLTKMLTGKEKYKMQKALWNMSHTRSGIQLNSILYSNIRSEYSKNCSINMAGESNPMFGKKNSGYKHTNEHKKHMSVLMSGENNPMFGKKQTKNFFNKKCKSYFFTYNEQKIDVYNLRKFCRENNLDQGAMTRVNSLKQNEHKGYSKWHQ